MELITKEILIHYTHFSKAVRVFGVVKVILPSDQIFQSQPRQPFHFPICPRLDQERRTQPDKINFIPGENVLDKKTADHNGGCSTVVLQVDGMDRESATGGVCSP